VRLAASILAADFGRLGEEIRKVEEVVDFLHLDVMDGHFVPNLTFGPPVANALRKHTRLPLEIHLMIDQPARYGPQFHVTPEDVITFHVEVAHPEEVLRTLRQLPCRVGLSLRPRTPLGALEPFLDRIDLVLVMSVEPGFGGQTFLPQAAERVRMLRAMIGDRPVAIAVDGGIGPGNVRAVVEAGAEIIVAGSAIFEKPDPRAAALELWKAAGHTKSS